MTIGKSGGKVNNLFRTDNVTYLLCTHPARKGYAYCYSFVVNNYLWNCMHNINYQDHIWLVVIVFYTYISLCYIESQL